MLQPILAFIELFLAIQQSIFTYQLVLFFHVVAIGFLISVTQFLFIAYLISNLEEFTLNGISFLGHHSFFSLII